MKRYTVIVTPEAQSNIREAFLYINARSPLNAGRWLQSLHDQIETLERFPQRCSYARERSDLGQELRQLLFKSHRIISSWTNRRLPFKSSAFAMENAAQSANTNKPLETISPGVSACVNSALTMEAMIRINNAHGNQNPARRKSCRSCSRSSNVQPSKPPCSFRKPCRVPGTEKP